MVAKDGAHIGNQSKKKGLFFFGTDGIRGNAETLLTNQLVRKIGFFCSQILPKNGPVLIGHDSRSSNERISSALTSGFSSAGREVWLLGLCPTPAIPMLIKKHNIAGGIMISASHNPPEDNGIKIFDATGEKISVKKQEIIDTSLQEENKIPSQKGDFCKQRQTLLKDYENSLLENIDTQILNNIPIVLDLCWGSATSCGEKIFQSLGAKVTSINSVPNGERINVNCGSTHLQALRKAILETNSEMGFAFDGDADRIIAIDRRGRIIDGDHILYLWGSNLQEKDALREQRLVATVMSNLGFEKAWIKNGGTLERTSVGDKYVHKAMVKTKASLGGEQSGHILSTINGLCGDGLLTALQLSKICAQKKISLSEWRNESFDPYPQKLINIPLSNYITSKRLENCKRLNNSIKNAQLQMGNDGRILIRKSGTEPVLRVMVEAKDKLLVNSFLSEISQIIYDEFS